MAFRYLKYMTLLFLLAGCLQTRHAIKQGGGGGVTSGPAPAMTPEATKAREAGKFDEINQDFRKLYGRVEVVENQMAQLKENEEINALKVKVGELETKLALLEETVAKLNSEYKKGNFSATPQDPYDKGNSYFQKSKWEDAILAFEEYRKKNPRGKSYSEATFKIGMSFKNLGMKQDAKAFFQEVVSKYPKSSAARQAKSQLKNL